MVICLIRPQKKIITSLWYEKTTNLIEINYNLISIFSECLVKYLWVPVLRCLWRYSSMSHLALFTAYLLIICTSPILGNNRRLSYLMGKLVSTSEWADEWVSEWNWQQYLVFLNKCFWYWETTGDYYISRWLIEWKCE